MTKQIVTMSGSWSVSTSASKKKDQWELARFHLSQFNFTTCSMRGHNGVTRPDGLSLKDYEEDLVAFLKTTGPSHLMVHSMAGVVAQAATNRVPELVKSLVLIASAPPGVKGIAGTKINYRFLRPSYVRAFCSGEAYSLKPADQMFLRGNNCTDVALGLESGLASRELLFRTFPVKPINTCPVLVIAAGRDQLLSIRSQRDICSYHGGDFVNIVDAQHMVHCDQENCSELFSEINRWLRSFKS